MLLTQLWSTTRMLEKLWRLHWRLMLLADVFVVIYCLYFLWFVCCFFSFFCLTVRSVLNQWQVIQRTVTMYCLTLLWTLLLSRIFCPFCSTCWPYEMTSTLGNIGCMFYFHVRGLISDQMWVLSYNYWFCYTWGFFFVYWNTVSGDANLSFDLVFSVHSCHQKLSRSQNN